MVAVTTEMDIFTISFPIRTVERNVLGAFSRCSIYLKPGSFLIFRRRSLILLKEKKAVSEEEKKADKSNKTIIAANLR